VATSNPLIHEPLKRLNTATEVPAGRVWSEVSSKVGFPGSVVLEGVLGGGAVQRDRHGRLDGDVAEIAEARRFEELEDERR
jgi:hypothetical protein